MLFGSRRMVVGIAILSIAAACGMTYVLYGTMQYVFRLGLDEQLKSVAAVAALVVAVTRPMGAWLFAIYDGRRLPGGAVERG